MITLNNIKGKGWKAGSPFYFANCCRFITRGWGLYMRTDTALLSHTSNFKNS
nr:MAG TPA: hypothetical protein [Bacteriophage sp.]